MHNHHHHHHHRQYLSQQRRTQEESVDDLDSIDCLKIRFWIFGYGSSKGDEPRDANVVSVGGILGVLL